MDIETMLRKKSKMGGTSRDVSNSSINAYAALAATAVMVLAPGVAEAKEAKMNPKVRKLANLVISEGRQMENYHCKGGDRFADVYRLETKDDGAYYEVMLCDNNRDGVPDKGDVLTIDFRDRSVGVIDKGLNGLRTPTSAGDLYNHPDSFQSDRTITSYDAHDDRASTDLRAKQRKAQAEYLKYVGRIIKSVRKSNSRE